MATDFGLTGASVSYAGFWLRFVAYLIDMSILMILGLAITIGSAFAGEMGPLIGTIILILINLLYWPVMESSTRQATFGKRAVGIEVVDLNGKRLTFLRSLLRNLAKIISALPLCIGYLLAAFTGRKQALHDMITKCLVVRTGPSHFFKAVAAAVGALIIAIGGGGAYFYYVIMPQAQDEFGEEMQATIKPNPSSPPFVTAIEQPPASAPVVTAAPKPPDASVEPAPARKLPLLAKPKAEPASAMQPSMIATAPVVVEQIPEPVKPAPKAQKAKPKKSAKKSVIEPVQQAVQQPEPVKMAEPVESKTATTESNQPASLPGAEVLPKAPAIVAFAPDSEARIIQPKYNDVMTAVLRGDREGVTQLLDLGWWVDKPGPDGYTPLVAAAMNRDTQMVQVLLSHGAVPSSQALKVARDKKDTATATLLEQYGAR